MNATARLIFQILVPEELKPVWLQGVQAVIYHLDISQLQE